MTKRKLIGIVAAAGLFMAAISFGQEAEEFTLHNVEATAEQQTLESTSEAVPEASPEVDPVQTPPNEAPEAVTKSTTSVVEAEERVSESETESLRLTRLDLKAQQGMAMYTKVIAWITGIGAGISGLGLVLLMHTLKQNTLATKAAQQSAEAAAESTNAVILSERAVLAIDSYSLTSKRTEKSGDVLQILLRVKNFGRSIATELKLNARIIWIHPAMDKSLANLEACPGIDVRLARPLPLATEENVLFNKAYPIVDDGWGRVMSKELEAVVHGRIEFYDIFRRAQRYLSFVYVYRFRADGRGELIESHEPRHWGGN